MSSESPSHSAITLQLKLQCSHKNCDRLNTVSIDECPIRLIYFSLLYKKIL